MFNRAYSIITNKDRLINENSRKKQGLNENEYQESVISENVLRELPTITVVSVMTTNESQMFKCVQHQYELTLVRDTC